MQLMLILQYNPKINKISKYNLLIITVSKLTKTKEKKDGKLPLILNQLRLIEFNIIFQRNSHLFN